MAKGRKVSPAKFLGAALGVVGGISNIIGGNKAGKAAAEQQRIAQAELDEQKKAFQGLDTSNLAAGVTNAYSGIQTNYENVYEDLTVNQQQAQFQAQQGAQQRSNILETMRGAAGGSGIAALAQSMANQGQLAAQQQSASIGQQESRNQALMAQGAGAEQAAEAQALQTIAMGEQQAEATRLQGAAAARGLEYEKTQGLMGLASGQLQAANEAKAAADAQKQAGISGIIGGVASGLAGGIGGSLMKGIGGKIGGALGKTKLGGALGNLAMQGGARIGEGGFGSGFLSGAGIGQFGRAQTQEEIAALAKMYGGN
tara:strand:+ start:6171 stop:7109 length:939 start_codon:yes stop_codon:yes gene_type:complete